jgi:CPA2 family monovalent cation:H+ antiporter-2
MTPQLITEMAVMSLVILLLVYILRKFRQPYFVAYIIAGILLGPQLLNIFNHTETITGLGELGVVLLMFFIGAEINLPNLTKNFVRPLAVAFIQLCFSFAFISMLSLYFNWDAKLIILLSFIISLSSSAIVFQYLTNSGEMHTSLGLLTCGFLLLQDLLVVPMMLVINFISGEELPTDHIFKACLGTVLSVIFLWAAFSKKMLRIPFKKDIMADHDLQVFVGFLFCFGFAWFTWFFGLSPALGAFMAGIIIGQDKSTHWLDNALIPFRVFFMAFFFISVGLQINIYFFKDNLGVTLALTLSILIINSLINTLVVKITGQNWRDSLYADALLSQIGEFSFVLMTLAKSLGLVNDIIHQIILAVIALTMVFSAVWVKVIQMFIYKPGITLTNQ